MIAPYESNGITFVDLDSIEHYELDGQPPIAKPTQSWFAPYTGT